MEGVTAVAASKGRTDTERTRVSGPLVGLRSYRKVGGGDRVFIAAKEAVMAAPPPTGGVSKLEMDMILARVR